MTNYLIGEKRRSDLRRQQELDIMEQVRVDVHPLQNPDILEKIFEGSPLKDLKVYRQVCKAWMVGSSKAMRLSAKVRIHNRKKDGRKGLPAFMALLENSQSTFIKAPFVDTFFIFDQSPHMLIFLKLYGHQIDLLHLSDVTFQSAVDFREAIFLFCPNLNTLSLGSCKVLGLKEPEPTEYVQPRYPQSRKMKYLQLREISLENFNLSWMDLFAHFPALEVLRVENGKADCDGLFRSLGLVQRNDPRNWNLKDLRFDLNLFRDYLEIAAILTAKELSLMNLDIVMKMPRDRNWLEMTLRAHARSLKYLCLKEAGNWGNLPQDIFPLPKHDALGNLRELSVDCKLFRTMSFLRYVPNLRKLALSNMRWSMAGNTKMEEIGDFALTSCVEIIVSSGEPMEGVEGLRKVIGWLPNIKTLEIDNLTSEGFALVCEHWTKLTRLVVTGGSGANDCGVTGLDIEDVERINRNGKPGIWMRITQRGKADIWRPITVPRANITNLKNLQELSFISCEKLGYSSAVCGIQHLSQLQRLNLQPNQSDDKTWNGTWTPLLAQFPWKDE